MNEIKEAISYFESLLRYFEDNKNDAHWRRKHSQMSREMINCALTALRAQLEPDGWISVEDRLPKKRHFVLVYAPMYRNVFECYLDGEGRWIFVNADRECTQLITHWRYLPRKPREGKI